MLLFTRKAEGKVTETEYENFEMDYAIKQMEESFWDGLSCDQAIIDHSAGILRVMADGTSHENEYPDYIVINVND